MKIKVSWKDNESITPMLYALAAAYKGADMKVQQLNSHNGVKHIEIKVYTYKS